MIRSQGFSIICIGALLVMATSAWADREAYKNLGSISDPDEKSAELEIEKAKRKDPLADIEGDFPALPEKLSWELILTQKAYRVRQTLKTSSELVTALQKGIEQLCFAGLQKTLSYRPNDRDPQCLALQKYLSEIDPHNTLLPCLSLGIESKECLEAYKLIETVSSMPSTILSEYQKISGQNTLLSRDLEVSLEEQRARSMVDRLRQSLTKVENLLSQKKDDSRLLNQREEIYDRILSTSCSNYRIVYFPVLDQQKTDTEGGTKKLPKIAGTPVKGSIEDLLTKGPFANTPGAEGPKHEMISQRYRVIHNVCNDAVNFIRSRDSKHPGPICYLKGMASPECIAARKMAGSVKVGEVAESGEHGLERFGE